MTEYMTEEEFNSTLAIGRTNFQNVLKPPEQGFGPTVRAALGGETLLGRILDVLSRGEYASANVVRDYISNKEVTTQAVIDGFKGKRKETYDRLVDDVFPHWGAWKRKALGFSLAMFGDPVTYIPGGIIAKPVKAATQVARKIPAVEKGVHLIDQSTISRAFRPQAGLPKDYYESKYYARKALESKNQKVRDDIVELRKGLSKQDMEELSYFREHPDEIELIAPRLKEKLDAIGGRFDALIDDAVANKIITSETAAKWTEKPVPYVPHYYPERGIRIARGEIPPTMFEKVKRPSFLKQRTFETLDDAIDLSKQFEDVSKAKTFGEARNRIGLYGLDDAFGKLELTNLKDIKSTALAYSKQYLPEKNILRAYGYRATEQLGYTARKKFVDDTLAQFGQKVPSGTRVVPEGYGLYLPKGNLRFFSKDVITDDQIARLYDEYGEMIPAGELVDAIKSMPGVSTKVSTYMLPKAIAKDLNKASEFFVDPVTSKMLKGFDNIQNAWKGMATVVRLPFHLRNMYSNWWQAYLSGIKNPQRFLQAAAVQTGKVKRLTLGGKEYSYSQLKAAIDDLGVHGKGWIGSDIQRSQVQEIESIIQFGKFRHTNPMRLGRAFGSAIEDNSRIAVFLDQVAKGKTFKEASQSVRKYLFDYTELTDFERNVMKRVLPFYTWSRKNIPLQIESLLTKPRKYQAYAKGLRAIEEDETRAESTYKPKYFNELMYIKSSLKTEQGKPMYMSIDLPPLEFNRMASLRHWASSTTPLKVLPEVLFNLKTFPEISRIESYTGEMAQAPFWLMYLPEGTRKKMADWKLIAPQRDMKTGKMIMGMRKKAVHAIHNALPFLNEMNRMYSQPISLSDESPKQRLRSYVTGIGHKGLDLNQERLNDLFRMQRDEQIQKKFFNDYGRMPDADERLELFESTSFRGQ